MLMQPLPHDVKKAIDLLRGDLIRRWMIDDLARRCGVPRRTLEKHFRRFIGCAPLTFLRTERLDQARRKLLRAPPGASVTEIAASCGLNHFGRFARIYRDRYGEAPSETLRWRRVPPFAGAAPFYLPAAFDRPTLALFPFGPDVPLSGEAEALRDAIGAALCRTGWVRIVTAPAGRYHLRCNVRDDGSGTLRIRLMLIDHSLSRYVWADCFECIPGDLSGCQEWLPNLVSGVLRAVLYNAEIARTAGEDRARSTAWDLSTRALPMVLAADPVAHTIAVELLDQAMELAPRDPVPMALSAWCHGLRAGHHFTAHPGHEREVALRLASGASGLAAGDPLSNIMLSAAYALVHDLATAEAHARRALASDGGASWGWGRLGWTHCYRGETANAIECFQIARVLGPTDPLGFMWSIGIAAANFQRHRFADAIQWYRRALADEPKATWLNRFMAPALLFGGNRDAARQSLRTLSSDFPELTIYHVMTGVPHTVRFLDQVAEGLAELGFPRA